MKLDRAMSRFKVNSTVDFAAEAELPTEFGPFKIVGFRSNTSDEEFVVLVKGSFKTDTPTLVRIHSQCMTGDVFHSLKCDCGPQLRRAMEIIQLEGAGLIVYQQQEGRGIGIVNKIRAYALQDGGADTIEANVRLGLPVDACSYDQCAEVIKYFGVRQVRLMSNNPEKLRALRAAGLKVVERVPLEVEAGAAAFTYLITKKTQMGHLLQLNETFLSEVLCQ